ncbi:MAG: hypothetical protein ACNA8W_17035 [Bradymonadaceae bacterium]
MSYKPWRVFVVVVIMLALGACGKDDPPDAVQIHPDPIDVGQDVVVDVSSTEDVSSIDDVPRVDTAQDALVDAEVAEDASRDAQSDADAATEPDADSGNEEDIEEDTVDAGEFVDPYEGRPLGQCTENTDCPEGPNGRSCSRALPGGACTGCSPSSGCPSDTTCSEFGACIMDCSNDDECAPGLRCLGTGRCAAMPCVNGECPVPLFGCSGAGNCERTGCTDQSDCPDQTTCISGLCIEDRALIQ